MAGVVKPPKGGVRESAVAVAIGAAPASASGVRPRSRAPRRHAADRRRRQFGDSALNTSLTANAVSVVLPVEPVMVEAARRPIADAAPAVTAAARPARTTASAEAPARVRRSRPITTAAVDVDDAPTHPSRSIASATSDISPDELAFCTCASVPTRRPARSMTSWYARRSTEELFR